MTDIDALQNELSIARQSGDKVRELDVLRRLSAAYSAAGQALDEFNCDNLALRLAREIGARQAEVEIMSNIALAISARGQVTQAIAIFESAVEIARANALRRHEVIAMLNLGIVYAGQDLEKSRQVLEQALQLGQQVDDLPDMALITLLDKLACAEVGLGQVEKSKEHMQKALSMCQFIGDKPLEGELLRSWGDAYRSINQFELAEPFLRQSILVFQDAKEFLRMAHGLGVLGETYMQTGKRDAAIKTFEFALQWFDALNMPNYVARCRDLIAELKR